MGETGCGKTRLIRYMCGLQAGPGGPRNMLLVKVSLMLEFKYPFPLLVSFRHVVMVMMEKVTSIMKLVPLVVVVTAVAMKLVVLLLVKIALVVMRMVCQMLMLLRK